MRIDILRKRPTAEVRAIADGIHRALVETFNAPLNDRFQLVQRHERDDLICDPDYLGIKRSDDIVIIHVVASRTRSIATKRAFYKAVTVNLACDPGVRLEDVQIILSSNEREDWSFGNGVASYADEVQA